MVFRKRLARAKVVQFFAAQAPCVVAMEACAGAHHWAREIGKLGHTVRLIPPAYVKPYVKRQKNDMADAEAICEAAQRPSMRFVPVRSEAQQASAVVFRARDLLVRQRTQCLNALRGPLSEYGYIVPQNIAHAGALIECVEDPNTSLPEGARTVLAVLVGTFRALDAQVRELDAEITRRAKADPVARRLMTVPGVGPIAATAALLCGRSTPPPWHIDAVRGRPPHQRPMIRQQRARLAKLDATRANIVAVANALRDLSSRLDARAHLIRKVARDRGSMAPDGSALDPDRTVITMLVGDAVATTTEIASTLDQATEKLERVAVALRDG